MEVTSRFKPSGAPSSKTLSTGRDAALPGRLINVVCCFSDSYLVKQCWGYFLPVLRKQHKHLGATIWTGSDWLPKAKALFHADVVTGQK